MSRRYRQAHDGEWIQPRMRGYKLRCCDCGLVHTLNFRVIERGRIGQLVNVVTGVKVLFQAERDERATAAVRRHRK